MSIIIKNDGTTVLGTALGDTVVDGALGTGDAQYAKIMDGRIGGTNKVNVSAAGGLQVEAAAVALGDHRVAAASNNAASIKGAAGTLYGVLVFNNAAYPIFVKFYNKAGVPAPAGDTPVLTIGVQAGLDRNVVLPQGGKAFSLGIGIAIVQGIADNDNTAVALSDCVVDSSYA
jgi:hypothetical protein